MTPTSTRFYLPDNGCVYAKTACQVSKCAIFLILAFLVNNADSFICEFRPRMFCSSDIIGASLITLWMAATARTISTWHQPQSGGMLHVFKFGDVLQIGAAIVSLIPISVINFLFGRAGAKKRSSNQYVNSFSLDSIALMQPQAFVSVLTDMEASNEACANGSHSSMIRDFIDSFPSRNSFPLFSHNLGSIKDCLCQVKSLVGIPRRNN
jgi:hypothetical protein